MSRRTLLVSAFFLAACGGEPTAPDDGALGSVDSPLRVALQRALGHVARHGGDIGFETPADTSEVLDVMLDEDGREHVRFARRFHGLRVLAGDFVVHGEASGAFESFSAMSRGSLATLSVVPGFDARSAVLRALQALGADPSSSATAELIVNAHGRAPALAYDVAVQRIGEDGAPGTLHAIIDASSGELQAQWDDVQTLTGTGHSLYSGPVSIDVNFYFGSGGFGGYVLQDLAHGKGFYTRDLNNATSGTGTAFTSSSTSFGTGTADNRATVAVDAHYGVAKAYDYFLNVHGRNGLDNAGLMPTARVHLGSRYTNANYNSDCNCLSFGDGDGVTYGPLVELDTVAHEYSHGITAKTAALIYWGESGGLNEATSDIFGTAVEHYTRNLFDPPDYKLGEKIYTPATAGDATRYMYWPALDGHSPTCWSSNTAFLDPHYSSGVGNHFFFLLAEGSMGTVSSPTCDGHMLSGGVGITAAARIWYRALTRYMTSGSDYADARIATWRAAADLYGSSSTAVQRTLAAWQAVGR